MYSKRPTEEQGCLSLSHLLENTGFSTLEDTVAEMYVLALGFYIFCEVDLCFILVFGGVLSLNSLSRKNTF